MKIYQKTYEDLLREPPGLFWDKIDSIDGDLDGLTKKIRDFYHSAHRTLFFLVVCQIWLSQQILYKGRRRKMKFNGIYADRIFSVYMKKIVGISQRVITINEFFYVYSSYIEEWFPDLLKHDPFKESEYYKYPFKHITLDHLGLVYQCHNRMDLLNYAEEKEMSIFDFTNWAVNQMLNYNDEIGRKIYEISNKSYVWVFIKNLEFKKEFKKKNENK